MKIDIVKNINKVAKILVKEYKLNPKENDGCIEIASRFYNDYDAKVKKHIMAFSCCDTKNGKNIVVPFGEMDYYGELFGDISSKIAHKVVELLKVKTGKNEVVYGTDKQWSRGSWYSSHEYYIYNSVTIVPLCKEFLKINKRLAELGMPMIEAKKWTYGELAGKRSQVFSKGYHYFASEKNQCDKVLAYLKGKKKLNKVEIVESVDDADREYGIEHETEWYGSYRNYIRFTDSKNKVENIY